MIPSAAPVAMRRMLSPLAAFTIIGKGLGMARQLLMAHYFGASRAMDIYFMAYNLSLLFSTPVAFTVGMTAMLRREDSPGAGSGTALASSLLIGAIVAAAFLAFIWPSVYLLTWGFAPEEKKAVVRMMLCFMPWVALSSAYAVYAGVLKGAHMLTLVLWSEVVVSVVSIGAFLAWHPNVESLPLSLALALAAALALLAAAQGGGLRLAGAGAFARQVLQKGVPLLMSQQASHLFAMTQRFFESHLRPGSLSLLGYSSTLIIPMHEVVGLREYYLPSLIAEEGRAGKLNRLLAGMLLLTVPISVFLYFNAPDVIGFVFGLVRRKDIDLAALAAVFGISALSVVLAAVTTPMFRLLQLEDPLRAATTINLVSTLTLAAPAFLLVTRGGADVKGMAWSLIISNLLTFYATLALLQKRKPLVDVADFHRTAALAGLVSAACAWAARRAAGGAAAPWGLLIEGTVFAGGLGLFFFFERRRLGVIFGGAAERTEGT